MTRFTKATLGIPNLHPAVACTLSESTVKSYTELLLGFLDSWVRESMLEVCGFVLLTSDVEQSYRTLTVS